MSPRERARLEKAYRDTCYRVDAPDGAIELRTGCVSEQLDQLLARHDAETWAFLTAANPGSRMLDPSSNAQRNADLAARLGEAGLAWLACSAIPDTRDWPAEGGFLIIGIQADKAAELARAFGQNAIVTGRRGGIAELVWCA